MYILDTNVVIELLKNNKSVISQIDKVGIHNCRICEITIAELYFGAVKGGNKKNYEDVQVVKRLFQQVRINDSFERYAILRNNLRIKGQAIDSFDLLIASVVKPEDILVTHNRKHFERIDELKIEDWQ